MPDVKLFVCGDVMTGRGIDQVLPHPGDPRLFEPYMESADGYVALAHTRSGPIRRPVDWDYVWGDAALAWRRERADASIVNLETAVTASDDAWPGKGIHYRMHPANVPVLTAAGIDCCTLANNHVLDWGHAGLAETLRTLHDAGLRTAGAGSNAAEAEAPATIEVSGDARIRVHAYGMASAGVPADWAATPTQGGVAFLPDLSRSSVERIARAVAASKGAGDIAVVSIHWGPNWGYRIAAAQRAFAHALVDEARVDFVLGHSSHHPIGLELWHDRPILYGCGDFLNDYEGIGGHEAFHGELACGYFATFAPGGSLARLAIEPLAMRAFRVVRPTPGDVRWLAHTLDRESRSLGTRIREHESMLVAEPA